MPTKERAEKRRSSGKCPECGGSTDRPAAMCTKCLHLHNKRSSAAKVRNIEAGRCSNCGTLLLDGSGRTKCTNCAEGVFNFTWN